MAKPPGTFFVVPGGFLNQNKTMKSTFNVLSILFLFLGLLACQTETSSDATPAEANPAADGFRAELSDAKAIALADTVMEAMGGRQAWDGTRYLRWTFFGRRTLLWDKQQKRVRIDVPGDSTVFLLDLATKTGKAMVNGQTVTDEAKLDTLMDQAESIWINDSYWLVMPYKLKDSGVALKYIGQDTTADGTMADVLELTFEEVGNTPQNKYLVYIDREERLVSQWAYFPTADAEAPAIVTPWKGYRPYSDILLSGDRGRGKLTDIAVYNKVPEEAFSNFAEPEL